MGLCEAYGHFGYAIEQYGSCLAAVWSGLAVLKSCLFEAVLGPQPKPWTPKNPGEVLSNLTEQHTFWFRFCQPYPLLQPTLNKKMLAFFLQKLHLLSSAVFVTACVCTRIFVAVLMCVSFLWISWSYFFISIHISCVCVLKKFTVVTIIFLLLGICNDGKKLYITAYPPLYFTEGFHKPLVKMFVSS